MPEDIAADYRRRAHDALDLVNHDDYQRDLALAATAQALAALAIAEALATSTRKRAA